MGIFEPFAKSKEPYRIKPSKGNPTVMGFLLLSNAQLDLCALEGQVRREFEGQIELEVRQDKLLMVNLHLEGTTLLCTHMPFPLPAVELANALEQSRRDPAFCGAVGAHQSFLILSTVNRTPERRLADCFLFERVCAALMGLSNVGCIYLSGAKLVIPSDRYRAQVELAKGLGQGRGDYFPTALWIGVVRQEGRGRQSAHTLGMEDFGLHELYLPDTTLGEEVLTEHLHQLCMRELLGPTPVPEEVITMEGPVLPVSPLAGPAGC